MLVLDTLDAAPAGKTYEAWVLDGDTPVRAGLFDGTAARDVVPLEQTVGAGLGRPRDRRAGRRRRRSDERADRRLAARVTDAGDAAEAASRLRV